MDTATNIMNIEQQLNTLSNLIEEHKALLQNVGFFRVKGVLEVIPISRSGWYNGVKKGRFPKPIKWKGVSVWKKRDIILIAKKIEEGKLI